MANVKEVYIELLAPFDVPGYQGGHITKEGKAVREARDRVAYFMAQCSGPCFGLKISWECAAESEVPNEHGGRTSMFRGYIQGMEAISWGALSGLKKDLELIGCRVENAKACDREDGPEWSRL